MSLKTQINNICKLRYYQIRNLSAIRNVLDMESAKAAANAFISSTIDYGNSLLYGLPGNKVRKLQLQQNSAARVVINACKSDRLCMTEVRKNLHWLPINARIEYKILMLTWKAYHETRPKYLSDLLHTIKTDISRNSISR